MHREGRIIIIGFLILFLGISWAIWQFIPSPYSYILILPFWILYGFVLWFFRNPIRSNSAASLDIIAPVDGKVVVVEEVEENEFIKGRCKQLSIFMSPVNVHVCRYPILGKVIFTKYHPGKFLVAYHPKSSELNERTTVVVEAENGQKVLFRQIAGAVARRIVMYAKKDDQAIPGQEYGFIKFGSRVDLFLPLDTEILVKVGDKTLGGVQKIAELK